MRTITIEETDECLEFIGTREIPCICDKNRASILRFYKHYGIPVIGLNYEPTKSAWCVQIEYWS